MGMWCTQAASTFYCHADAIQVQDGGFDNYNRAITTLEGDTAVADLPCQVIIYRVEFDLMEALRFSAWCDKDATAIFIFYSHKWLWKVYI